jgi:spore coat-associated protein N
MLFGARSTAIKIFASVVLVGGAASVAGLGTFGSFTSTTDASASVSTGKVVLTSAPGSVRGLDVAATNMVPGDNIQRSIALTRSTDTQSFGSVKLTTTAGSVNNLTNAAVANSMQLKIDQCSVAWVKAPASNDLTCSGTTTPVVAQRAILGSAIDLAPATTTLNTAAAVSNLRVTMSLPTEADNTFQGLSNTVTFTFDATQRANTSL